MIKVNAGQVYAAKDAIAKIGDLSFPIKRSLKVSKFIKKFNEEIELIETQRTKIVVACGVSDEKQPGMYNIPLEKRSDYANQLNELAETEVELDVERLSSNDISTLSDGTEAPFSANDLTVLEPFIEFKEE